MRELLDLLDAQMALHEDDRRLLRTIVAPGGALTQLYAAAEALRPFAAAASLFEQWRVGNSLPLKKHRNDNEIIVAGSYPLSLEMSQNVRVSVGDFRRARAALVGIEGEPPDEPA